MNTRTGTKNKAPRTQVTSIRICLFASTGYFDCHSNRSRLSVGSFGAKPDEGGAFGHAERRLLRLPAYLPRFNRVDGLMDVGFKRVALPIECLRSARCSRNYSAEELALDSWADSNPSITVRKLHIQVRDPPLVATCRRFQSCSRCPR